MSREQFFVPLELQLGVHPALQQDLVAAQGDRLLDLLQQLVAVEDVAFGVSGLRENAQKPQTAGADVRVVDVAVDVVGAKRLGMQPARDGVGRAAERGQVVRFQQRKPFVAASAARRRRLYREVCAIVETKFDSLRAPVPIAAALR